VGSESAMRLASGASSSEGRLDMATLRVAKKKK